MRTKKAAIKRLYVLLFCCLGLPGGNRLHAQDIQSPADTLQLTIPDSLLTEPYIPPKRWMPDPKRALWLALVIPGGGQIYNRKYWKLPLVYGGFVGCAYALSWNNMMYKDYSQAYLDIMDDDPNTKSYEDFLPYNVTINDSNRNRYQEILKRKKDYYRKYRDMSIFVFIGVYLLSVIDAYVDAELSSFDINDDLSLKIEPTVIQSNDTHNAFSRGTSYGVQCRLKF